ncbi:MAG: LPS export ABC transporter permease LptF [Candidatus Rariloculaceae bacterium]
MNLISRYIFRETFGSWFMVTLILFVILISNQFAEILDDAAVGRLPRDAVFSILGLISLRYLNILTPIGLFLGVMLALARLNRDSEMAALAACGIGPGKLLGPITVLATLLSVSVAWLALVQAPNAARAIEEIKQVAEEELELGVLESGKFTTPDSGDTIVYAKEVDGDVIYDVFIEHQAGDEVIVILADRGERVHDVVNGDLTFVLYDGRRYEGVPGQRNFRVIDFAEHGMPIRVDEDEESEVLVETIATIDLLNSTSAVDQAELQWRISAPIQLFVLMLLAVPLSRSRPREGRYGRLGVGILIYITYANMLSIARVWVEREEIPLWIGLWWVHIVLGLFGLLLLGRESGWFASSRTADRAELAT